MTVLIAGAGIAGLTLGLTLHQLKIPFRIYEAVETLKPLGVGINIQGFTPRPGWRSGPSRAGVMRAMPGRSIRCIAASCRWSSLAR